MLIICIILYKRHKNYTNSAYYQITKLPYRSVKKDLGRYGEYLTYKRLKKFKENGSKFLFNLYIPRANDQTTEIDVLMISPKGLFAFESKNYSGWIFGSEHQKHWYQTLPTGRGESHKEKFYNPVMQNRNHIKHLKTLIGENYPIHSIIVFSDRCTLKDVQIKSTDIKVINRYDIADTVVSLYNQESDEHLSSADIVTLHDKLYPYTQLDVTIKEKHIADINNKLSPSTPQPTISASETFAESTDMLSNKAQDTSATIPTEPETVTQKNNAESENIYDAGSENVPGDSSDTNAANPSNIILSTESPSKASTIPQTEQLKCPRCGGNLVVRTATRGTNAGNQFYGCSNFPRCRYIQNITKETV